MPRPNTTLAALIVAATLFAAPGARAQAPNDIATMQSFINIMQGYFEIIEATHDIADSAEKAAILQMQKIKEIYEERGEKARAVEVYQGVLEDSRNPAIRNAAFMLLGETLKEIGRTDDAIRYLREGLQENIRAASGD